MKGVPEEEDESSVMLGNGGPCHLYGVGAPQQKINSRARGHASQHKFTSHSDDMDQAEQMEKVRVSSIPTNAVPGSRMTPKNSKISEKSSLYATPTRPAHSDKWNVPTVQLYSEVESNSDSAHTMGVHNTNDVFTSVKIMIEEWEGREEEESRKEGVLFNRRKSADFQSKLSVFEAEGEDMFQENAASINFTSFLIFKNGCGEDRKTENSNFFLIQSQICLMIDNNNVLNKSCKLKYIYKYLPV